MAEYNFKIQARFLDNVRKDFKKHEYRLCNEEKSKIKPGDYINLVSNDNEKDCSKVIVTKVDRYSNWEDALKDDWKPDFANVVDTLDKAIEICKTFYSEEDVKKYGIIKYEIKCVDGIDYQVLRIEYIDFNDIDSSIPFFDSLKEDYPDFIDWFSKKQKNHDKAYVYRNDKGIAAFLYLKTEIGEDKSISPNFLNKRRLKIGTFKVSESAGGFRLGERFLKIAFDNAKKQNVDELYITLFEKRQEVNILKDMLLDWGFKFWGTKGDRGESVFVKSLRDYDESKTVKFNFPVLKSNRNMFYLPIMAEYHTKLFPDLILKTENKADFYDLDPSSYSLEKVYVCGVNPYDKGAKDGDTFLIYYMGKTYPKHYSSTCTGLAVLATAKTFYNLDDFLTTCKNKSVFSTDELKKLFNKFRTVIKLIPYKTFEKKIPLYKLREAGVIGIDGPRPFNKISKEFYESFENHK